MPAEDRNHGQYGQVLVDPNGGAAPVQLVSLDKWDLDLSTDKAKVTAFEDPNHVYVQGKPDIKGSFSGFYDASAEGLTLFDMILGTVAPFLQLVPNRLAPTQFFSGHGWVDGKISVDSNGGVTTGGAWVAADGWTTPVNPA